MDDITLPENDKCRKVSTSHSIIYIIQVSNHPMELKLAA
jgi:hypothetical protein